MSTGYPADIETGLQWRVRHQAPGGVDREIVRRNLTETQAVSLEKRLIALAPVREGRLITVGDWTADIVELEAELTKGEDDDEADG